MLIYTDKTFLSCPSVILGKKVNGTIEFVEVILKNGSLSNKTMWKKRGATIHQATSVPARKVSPSLYQSIDDFLEKVKLSSVLVENGESMVVYHGTGRGGWWWWHCPT